jgi:hypothetical protein
MDEYLPIFLICPRCKEPADTGKMRRYVADWERENGRPYPVVDSRTEMCVGCEEALELV